MKQINKNVKKKTFKIIAIAKLKRKSNLLYPLPKKQKKLCLNSKSPSNNLANKKDL